MHAALDKNYFEIFGLPETFDIDISSVKDRYHSLQQSLHPDRYASASDQERRISVQMSALVNEAFQTLLDPLRRGRYLLQLRGIDTDEEIDTAMEPSFLMEQMELREALDSACQAAQPQPALESLVNEVNVAIDLRIENLRGCLALDGDADSAKARNIVRELQFLKKLASEIEMREEEIL